MSAQKLRVLVVEDSLTVRRRLCETLAADSGFEVVGEAENGQRCIELCRTLRPDVITLDMDLPIMSGLSATEYIMAHCPTPILIVSASTNRGELFKTYDALSAGAVDILEKPRGDASDDGWEERFCAAVRMVARIKVITHPRARLALSTRSATASKPPSRPGSSFAMGDGAPSIVAIGASTGGPSALVSVIKELPKQQPLTTLLVLHIDHPFASAFADWLSDQTGHHVRFAAGGEPLEERSSRVLMASPGRHLTVEGGLLRLSDGPDRHSCRPSIDVLFESLAKAAGSRCAAALLTGMGRDGAAGLLAIRVAGGLTVAQDEASSVVWGMPREAVLLGAATHVLPLNEIGRFLAGSVSLRPKRP